MSEQSSWLSPDGRFRWDGYRWWPIGGLAAPPLGAGRNPEIIPPPPGGQQPKRVDSHGPTEDGADLRPEQPCVEGAGWRERVGTHVVGGVEFCRSCGGYIDDEPYRDDQEAHVSHTAQELDSSADGAARVDTPICRGLEFEDPHLNLTKGGSLPPPEAPPNPLPPPQATPPPRRTPQLPPPVSKDQRSYWDGAGWQPLPGGERQWDGYAWQVKPPHVDAGWNGKEWIPKPKGRYLWDGTDWHRRRILSAPLRVGLVFVVPLFLLFGAVVGFRAIRQVEPAAESAPTVTANGSADQKASGSTAEERAAAEAEKKAAAEADRKTAAREAQLSRAAAAGWSLGRVRADADRLGSMMRAASQRCGYLGSDGRIGLPEDLADCRFKAITTPGRDYGDVSLGDGSRIDNVGGYQYEVADPFKAYVFCVDMMGTLQEGSSILVGGNVTPGKCWD